MQVAHSHCVSIGVTSGEAAVAIPHRLDCEEQWTRLHATIHHESVHELSAHIYSSTRTSSTALAQLISNL
jgi:hypothetical protein